ncbi:M48 family metallopeptidase [Pedobacter sp. SYSU D00535]|uniref:M48 family metallopeptidase n=1 Tax=Pedobacter sp. SYSU D00535 TaxID=2810308 RepID=UPI001A96380B|nr:M48 family metallopeptidase [Pedobacter sp. SYSU D00535]
MDRFNVLYFDGQTSLPKEAVVSLELRHLTIVYLQDDEEKRVVWELDQIQPIEISGNLHILRYGDFPLQQIDCKDHHFYKALADRYPGAAFLKISFADRVKGWNVVAITLGFIAIMASVYFLVLPPVAELLAGQIPQTMEVQLGNSLYEGFVSEYEKNEKLTKLTNSFSREIDFNTSYPIDVTVVKSPQVNAFALPGGKVVIYDGLLKKMRSAEELAALLSHEVGHIEHRHSLKSISRSLSGYIFVSLILNDINGLSAVLVDNANTLNNLSYSRSLEADADARAVETLDRNNLDQKGLVGLFEILNKEAGEDTDYLKFLSTHPLTKERMQKAREAAAKQGPFKKNPRMEELFREISENGKAK